MSPKSRKARASVLRRKLHELEGQREGCLKELLELRDLFAASLSTVYRTCGKPSCACTRGQLHGPYYFLSIQSAGRNDRYHVSKEIAQRMQPALERYRTFILGLRQLRSLDRQVENHVRRLQRVCETRSIKSFTT
ncbi:MAG: hypothetical protein HYU36_23990 [Planctomycetes bacterium]|nr:hypothetical protein [Planctomycetota bacterium]